MVLLITPLTVQADHHATSGPGEGSFTGARRFSLY